jgi:hypothetical protein
MEPERRASQLSALWVVVYLGSSLPIVAVGFLARAYGILPAVGVFAAVAGAACLGLAAVSLRAARA